MPGWLARLTGLALALAAAGAARADSYFRSGELLSGTTSTQGACTGEAVWVEVQGRGDCIRYYGAGLGRSNPAVLVFFHGDVLSFHGRFSAPDVRVNAGYEKDSPEREARNARRWAARLDEPYIFLARPGTHGSSGDHKRRRQLREVLLVNAALDAIRRRYGITRFVLAGQSGGGHLAAAMLAMRDDIACAVAASGVTAVRMRDELRGWPADATGLSDYWDPADHVVDIRPRPGLRIFVLGDPADSNVPFAAQRHWYDLLRSRGLDATLLTGSATGRQHHELPDAARTIAGWCAHGLPTPDIIRMAAQLRG